MDITEKTLLFFTTFTWRPGLARTILEKLECTPDDIIDLRSADLLRTGIPERYILRLKDAEALERCRKDLLWYAEQNIRLLTCTDPDFPEILKECADPPGILFVRGDAGILARKRGIALIGTRNCTGYGQSACRSIIRNLAENAPGTVIISGMAEGIDSCAHRAALEFGLKTVAVTGTGPETTFPTFNRELQREISTAGAVITEFPRDTRIGKISFLQRNRIIAGLSNAVIVAESGIRGGAMNTASVAFSYNRDVFAVPGRVGDSRSEGCNRLISENCAQILDSMDTFYRKTGHIFPERVRSFHAKGRFENLNSEKRSILLSLGDFSKQDIGRLQKHTGISYMKLAENLLELEMEGTVRSLPGNRYVLNEIINTDLPTNQLRNGKR